MSTDPSALTRKDFTPNQDLRWCPGCGDYSIHSMLLSVLPTMGVPKEKIVIVSGIGCSSRFPYYVDTYGFHTIHGRAATVATGLKAANPDLNVWLITGDGDGLSIGGNHTLHLLRRNLDINVILFNNEIYGLTKGQYSPTSTKGLKTKTSPMGSIEQPMRPCAYAIGAGANFVARTTDKNPKHLKATLERAAGHSGACFIEVLQNCVIFNDGVHSEVTDKDKAANNQLVLKAGEPLCFGENNEKGIMLDGFDPKVVDVSQAGEDNLLRHDPTIEDIGYASMLSHFSLPDFPVPMGVFRQTDTVTYDSMIQQQVEVAKANRSDNSLEELYTGFSKASTWEVE